MTKKLIAMIMMMATSAVLAGINDTVFSFSTKGADKYADGTVVADGECYALVWVNAGAEFKGFLANGKLVDAEQNRVVVVAPVARKGHCPKTVVQIDEDFAKGLGKGSFSVVLMDTRVTRVDGSVVLADLDDNGLPTAVAAIAEVAANIAVDGGFADAKAADAAIADGTAELPSSAAAPIITGFKAEGGILSITFTNVENFARYNIKGGATVDAIDCELLNYDFNGEADKDGEMTINFAIAKLADCRFFKVVRR